MAVHLLAGLFAEVHVVEQSSLLEHAAEYARDHPNVNTFISSAVQNFNPLPSTYDAIWLQWLLGFLDDASVVSVLTKLQRALKPGGLIFVKDNIVDLEAFFIGSSDSQILRSMNYQEKLFEFAGLTIVNGTRQRLWAPARFPIYMYALRP